MSDAEWYLTEAKAREARQADVVQTRLSELYENPIKGAFDLTHLKAIHEHVFRGMPQHEPGITRNDSRGWVKTRVLEGQSAGYPVHYAHDNIAGRIDAILTAFGGSGTLKGLTPEAAAPKISTLYGDLDHAHGFFEGNSRTLREFTRELALEAGFLLDWTGTSVGRNERNALYIARDVAVLQRAFPGLTPERAMVTNDRAEYEACFVLTALQKIMGENSIDAIILARLTSPRKD